MDTVVNQYDLTCELRCQIGMLQHRHKYKRQIRSFYFIGMLALICFGGGFWMRTLWYPAIIFGAAFLIYIVWMKYHMCSIKKEFLQNTRFYPVEKVIVECGDKIKITIDESEHADVYDYSMVRDIRETKDFIVLLLYTTAVVLAKERGGSTPEELEQVKKRCSSGIGEECYEKQN